MLKRLWILAAASMRIRGILDDEAEAIPDDARITEDGEVRVTEDGETRITE